MPPTLVFVNYELTKNCHFVPSDRKRDACPVAFVVFASVPAAYVVVVVFAVIAVVSETIKPPERRRMSAPPERNAGAR